MELNALAVTNAADILSLINLSGDGSIVSTNSSTSNVDLATELTKIIAFQRGYQANAKIITVTDQIMQDTLNM